MPEEPRKEVETPNNEVPPIPNEPTFTPAESSYVPQPTVASESTTTEPTIVSATKPPKKLKLPVIIGIIVAGALLLLGGGTALAYNLWYQNPDKVVSDAIVNAITAKSVSATGVMDIESDGATFKIEFSGKSNSDANAAAAVKVRYEADEFSYNFDGEGIFSSEGDLYIKVDNAREVLESVEAQSDRMLDFTPYDAVITKIDGNWIKIGKDDLGEYSEEYEKSQKCYADISKSLETDNSFRKTVENETYELFKMHQFITVGDKLGSRTINGQGSLGYTLNGDEKVADEFFTHLADTELGKKLKACDETIKFDDIIGEMTEEDDSSKTEVQVWISRFGHQLTELSIKGEDSESKGTILLNPVFNKNEAIEIPTDVVTFSELQADLEAATDAAYSSYYDSYEEPMYEADDSSHFN